jgi:hypothetical protein
MARKSAKPKTAAVKAAPRFRDLSVADRRRVAAVIVGTMKRVGYLGRGGYKVVHGPDQLNREWTSAEHGGETDQLTAHERNRLIGEFLEAYRDRFDGVGETGEGLRLVRQVSRELARQGKPGELPRFWMNCAARLLGNRAGRRLARRGTGARSESDG